MSDTISVPDPGSNVESFDFNGAPVRVIAKSPDEPWFVASDVAKVLGYAVAKDMTRNLDDDEKDGQNVPTPGGTQAMTVISESGLYSAVLRSRVPQAKEFKRWVTREVLPSIRRHGTYMTGSTIERVLQDPDTLIQLATQLKDERAAREASEKRAMEIEELRASGDTTVRRTPKLTGRGQVYLAERLLPGGDAEVA